MTSLDTSVVEVEDGKLKGVSPGIATVQISVPYEDNPDKSYIEKLNVSVMKPGEIILTDKSLIVFSYVNLSRDVSVFYPKDIKMPLLSKYNWKSSDPDILKIWYLSDNSCTLRGVKPGKATLTFTDGDFEEICEVTVLDSTPAPSALDENGDPLESGSQLAKGTKVKLYAPENGTVWYTLDESDPVSSETRIEYSDPITVNSNIIIKAYAEPYKSYASSGLKPSETVEFVYTVDSNVGVSGIEDDDLKVEPTKKLDGFTVQGAVDASVRVISPDGKTVMKTDKLSGELTVNMNEYVSGVYIVNVRDAKNNVTLKFLKR